ncbi:Titin [Portunus trituberculatus]|uniref:Titin n=1 Tax=Portunus trituberculatus TaxID=210409 RepID=A0A5B7FYL8_PORTR|nr:Titin [Portunus trituberculatus]
MAMIERQHSYHTASPPQISRGMSNGGMAIRDTILNSTSSSSSESSTRLTPGAEEGEGFRSVLTVPTKTRHDSQVFFCLASNVYGNDTKKINLIVQEVPGTPGTPRVVGSGSRAVNLTWTAPSHDGNSPVSLYRILIINSTGNGTRHVVLWCLVGW